MSACKTRNCLSVLVSTRGGETEGLQENNETRYPEVLQPQYGRLTEATTSPFHRQHCPGALCSQTILPGPVTCKRIPMTSVHCWTVSREACQLQPSPPRARGQGWQSPRKGRPRARRLHRQLCLKGHIQPAHEGTARGTTTVPLCQPTAQQLLPPSQHKKHLISQAGAKTCSKDLLLWLTG